MESPFSEGNYGHYSQLDVKSRKQFDKALMEQAKDDDVVYQLIADWAPERVEMYQTAFYLYNLASQLRQVALDAGESLMEYIMEHRIDEDEDTSEDDDSDDNKPFQLGI
jgi:hypothetical protein